MPDPISLAQKGGHSHSVGEPTAAVLLNGHDIKHDVKLPPKY